MMCSCYRKDTLGLCIFKLIYNSAHAVDFSANTRKCPLRNWLWHAMFYLLTTSYVGFVRAVNFYFYDELKSQDKVYKIFV